MFLFHLSVWSLRWMLQKMGIEALIRQKTPSLVHHSHNHHYAIDETTRKIVAVCSALESNFSAFCFETVTLEQFTFKHGANARRNAQHRHIQIQSQTANRNFRFAKRQWHWPRDNHRTLIYHRHYQFSSVSIKVIDWFYPPRSFHHFYLQWSLFHFHLSRFRNGIIEH